MLNLLLVLLAAAAAQPPASPKRPIVDEYHGTKVTDDYRWLEQADDAGVRAWTAAQNEFARTRLDAVPQRKTLRDRIGAIMRAPHASRIVRYIEGVYFIRTFAPPRQQPYLAMRTNLDDPASEKIAIDPIVVDPSGATAMDWFVVGPGARKIAVSLSRSGSEDGTLHIFDLATGRQLPDRIPRVQYPTGGGAAAWNADGTGLFYTRYPAPGERPPADMHFYQQIWFHKLGDPIEKDTYVLGKDFPRIAEVSFVRSDDGRFILARVADGDGGRAAFFIRTPDGQWTQLSRLEDPIRVGHFSADGALWMIDRRDAPRGRLIRIPLDGPPRLDRARVVVPQSDAVLENFAVTRTRVYTEELYGGPSRLRTFD